jgi:FAD dependent oxidoreductase
MAAPAPPKQHGVKGVYYGGEWLDLEDCHGKFVPEKCSGCDFQEACPRSRSRNVTQPAAGADGPEIIYDICVIGAGCIGAAVSRELSKYKASILWIEAADDVSQGATKGNSGIVHAGFDDKPGSVRAQHCWPGNQMFAELDKELRFGYQKNGSLVLALNDTEVQELNVLMERGRINGVKNLRIVKQPELREMEPHANPKAIAALYAPEAGNVIPYEFAIALAENAVDNGVELRIRSIVTKIDYANETFTLSMDHWEPHEYINAMRDMNQLYQFACLLLAFMISGFYAALRIGGTRNPGILLPLSVLALLGVARWIGKSAEEAPSKNTPLEEIVKQAKQAKGKGGERVEVSEMLIGGSGSLKQGKVIHQSKVQCKYVINCAGGAADQIAKLIGDESFKIMPRLGDYLLLNRNQVTNHLKLKPIESLTKHVETGTTSKAYYFSLSGSCSWERRFSADDVVGQSDPWANCERCLQGRSKRHVPSCRPGVYSIEMQEPCQLFRSKRNISCILRGASQERSR